MAEAVARSVSSNNFAEHVSVSIQRAMLGKDIILRNEKDNARRVQVIHCSESAGNVSVGDVFFAVDGHPLPLRTNAVELEDTRGSQRPCPPPRVDRFFTFAPTTWKSSFARRSG